MHRLAALSLALMLAGSSGCALFASANAAHSHVTPCIDHPTYAIVDLVLGGISAAAVGGGGLIDDSMAWMALPGVFFASALIGGISVHMCNADKTPEGDDPIVTNSAPSFGDAPVDPETRMATPEEMGITGTPPKKTVVTCAVTGDCPENQFCWIVSGTVGQCVQND